MSKFKHLFILWLAPLTITISAQTRIIAHRGCWDTDGSAQNSLASLIKADSIGVYGAEFDMHITRDGVVVVFQDDDIIRNDRPDTVNIETNDYEVIKHIRLANGELLPALYVYLSMTPKMDSRLILEVKEPRTPEAEARCVREVLRQVQAGGLKNRTDYISFSRYICELLHKLEPRADVAYLCGDLSLDSIKALGLSGIDYEQQVLMSHQSG